MKAVLLTIALAVSVSAQDIKQIDRVRNWKFIQEMSGEIPEHPGLITEVHAAQISRGGDLVKLLMRFEYPWGSPRNLFKSHVPKGLDPSSIRRVLIRFEFNCKTLVMKTTNETAEVWQFNGKRHKSKEPPFTIESSHVFAQYFCEQGTAPTIAPTLKSKP